MNETLLERLGFTRNEIKVYLFLAERGRSPVQLVSKHSHMPRSTVYSVLDVLENRGLIRAEKLRGATVYRAREPEAIFDWLKEDERRLQERQTNARAAVEQLKQVFRPGPAL